MTFSMLAVRYHAPQCRRSVLPLPESSFHGGPAPTGEQKQDYETCCSATMKRICLAENAGAWDPNICPPRIRASVSAPLQVCIQNLSRGSFISKLSFTMYIMLGYITLYLVSNAFRESFFYIWWFCV